MFIFLGALATHAFAGGHAFAPFDTGAITGGGAVYTKSLDVSGLTDTYLFYTISGDWVGGANPAYSNEMNLELNNGGSTVYLPSSVANYGAAGDSASTKLIWTGMMKQTYPGGSTLTVNILNSFDDASGPYTSSLSNVTITIYVATPEKQFSPFNTGAITGGGAVYTKSLDVSGLTDTYLFYSISGDWVGGANPAYSNEMNLELNNGGSTVYLPSSVANYGAAGDSASTKLIWTGMMKQTYPGGSTLTVNILNSFDDASGPYTSSLSNVTITIYSEPSAAVLPTLTTSPATSISATSATLGGNVSNDGGATVSERGVVYSSSDTDPEIGDAGVTQDSNGTGTGSFSESIGSLSQGTTFYFKAYAINSAGTAYGGVQSFTTNTSPEITIDNTTLAFTEGNAATQVDAAATASDADGDSEWNGGTLEVQITANNEAADEISIPDNIVGTISTSGTDILNGASAIGTLSESEGTVTNGTKLTITFNSSATNALVQQVLQAIHYQNTSDAPGTANRTITFTATDKNGGTASDTRTVSVTASNDDPAMTGLPADIAVNEDVAGNVDFSAATFSDADAGSNNVVLTITAGAGTLAALSGGSVTVGGSGTGTLTLTGTAANIDTYLNTASNIKYTSSLNAYGNNATTLTVIANDGGNSGTGGGTDVTLGTVNVDITEVNDPPTLTAFTTVVDATTQNTEVEITFADLAAQGNEADVDGTVDAFVVNALSSGTLNIGANSAAATAFNSVTNKTIDALNNAYWTPANNVYGTQNAFTTTVLDNDDAGSTGPVQVTVTVNDITNPEVSFITLAGTPAVTDSSITYTVTFSEPVTNVSVDDFTLSKGSTADGTIASVSASSGTSINVVVNGITGTGTLRLDLNTLTDIADGSANTPPAQYTSGSVHTVDRDNPTLSSSVPADNATGVSASANITLTFTENIAFGTGNIQIIDVDDGSSTVTIDAASPGVQASISTNTLTLNPLTELEVSTNYSVRIAATAIDDSNGNSYAGITDDTTLNFTTVPIVAFNSTNSNGLESLNSANLQVDLSVVSGLAVTVEYAVTGTATGSGTDYTLANGMLTISAGSANNNITIAGIVNDLLDENNETVVVTLSNPANASLGTNTVHTYTIIDNDSAPTVSFTAASQSSVDETSTMTITAQLSAISGKDVTVPFSINASSTATGGGTDYTISSSPLTISAGSINAPITITIITDALVETNETVVVDMGTPFNATQGAITTHTATITNDDASPTVNSIVRQSPSSAVTSADSVTFRITFSKDMQNVNTADFTLSGTAGGDGSVASVSGVSASVYDINITGLTNSNGTVNLDIIGSHDIQDTATNALLDTTPSVSDETYTLDNTAPVINGMPANIATNTDPGLNTAVVSWAEPTASDIVDGAITPNQTAGPNSGSTFPVGTVTVTYSATDTAGNSSSASFTVTVVDGESPLFSGVPADITVPTINSSTNIAVVTWTAPTATDNVDGPVSTIQTTGLASGSEFPVGTTIITYEATDSQGNTSTASFAITVVQKKFPWLILLPALVSPNKVYPGVP